MDSGNSGSLQSSSGEDEFDSRADAISAAMMNNPRGGGLSPPLSSSAMFDSLSSSSFFDSISRPPPPPPQQQQLPFHHHNNNNNSNSVLNLDMATWSKTLRSDPNCTEIINNNSSSLQSLFTHQNHDLQNPSPPPPLPVVVPPENSTTNNNTTARADPQPHGQRNPKKRSRASRRAPTTVLTTDTTNFRAMVQEFTGIPAPPFTASSSPFPRARGLLDLYGTPSTIRSSNHHYSLDNSSTNTNTVSTPSYLRRPFPQKVQLPPPPFLSSAASSSSSSSSSSSTTTASPLINYHLSSSPPQSSSSSLFNVPNQILTSLLQSNNHPSKSSLPFLDDFGLGPGGGSDSVTPILNPNPTSTTTTTNTNTTTLSGLPGLISSDQTMPRNNSINDNIPPPIISWGNGIGSSIHDENDHHHHHHHHHQVVRGNNASSDNAAAAAGGGGGGGTGGRAEGMMESWICSSD